MTPVSDLYERLQAPEAALLEKRMAKKLFVEHGELSSADKKALSEHVEQILWKYTFTPSTVAIAPYKDQDCEFTEVALLEVVVRSRTGVARLAELVHRTIPYPVLLVLADAEGLVVSVAGKRFSKAESGALVATDLAHTPWSCKPPCQMDIAFFDSLQLRSLNQRDFLAFYQDIHARVVARNCGEATGRFHLTDEAPQERELRRKQLQVVQKELDRARGELRKRPSIARSVELNTHIQDLKRQLAKGLETL